MNSLKTLVCLLIFIPFMGKAQLNSYQYSRKIENKSAQRWAAIPLSPGVLAASMSSLKDMRILNINEDDTLEVPYLLQWMGSRISETQVPFERLPEDKNQKCCSYVNLKFAKDARISQIKLDVVEQNFEKSIKVQGSNDNQNWQTIIDRTRIAGHYDDLESYNYSTIYLNTEGFIYYRLIMDDDGNTPITIKKIHAFSIVESEGLYGMLPVERFAVVENKKDNITEAYIEFKDAYYVSQLQIIPSKEQEHFHRNYNVYYLAGSMELRNGKKDYWAMMNASVLSSLKENFVECYNNRTKKIKIEIFNNNNQPVKIDSVLVTFEKARLVAKLPTEGHTYLVYGKANDKEAIYDINYFTDEIPTDLAEVKLGKEVKQEEFKPEPPTPSGGNKSWLWVIMTVVIALVGAFSLRLLRKT